MEEEEEETRQIVRGATPVATATSVAVQVLPPKQRPSVMSL